MSASGPKKSSSWLNKLNSFIGEDKAKELAATLMAGEGGLGHSVFLDMMNRANHEPTHAETNLSSTDNAAKKKKPKF